MLRTILTWQRSFLLVLLSLSGCRSVDKLFCNGAGCEWTKEEWARVQSLSNPASELGLPELPGNPSNAYNDNPEVVELGRMFYFDPRFSGNATLTDSIGRPVPYARAARGTADQHVVRHLPRPEPRGRRLHLRAQHRFDRRRVVRRERTADGERVFFSDGYSRAVTGRGCTGTGAPIRCGRRPRR